MSVETSLMAFLTYLFPRSASSSTASSSYSRSTTCSLSSHTYILTPHSVITVHSLPQLHNFLLAITLSITQSLYEALLPLGLGSVMSNLPCMIYWAIPETAEWSVHQILNFK